VLVLAEGNVQTARAVLSGVAPIPWRSTEAEKALVGKPVERVYRFGRSFGGSKWRSGTGRERLQDPLAPGILQETLTAFPV
jgi:hypothetical protein